MARRLSPSEAGRLAQETKIAKADTERDKEGHNIGWPHLDSRGVCVCYCKRCLGPDGCICVSCTGIGHVNCARATEKVAA